MQISTKQLVDTTRNTILESVTNDTQSVISLLRKNGIQVPDDAQPTQVFIILIKAIKDSPVVRKDYTNYLKTYVNSFKNYVESYNNADATAAATKKSYEDTFFGKLFPTDKISQLLDTGINLYTTNLTNQSQRQTEENALKIEQAKANTYYAQGMANVGTGGSGAGAGAGAGAGKGKTLTYVLVGVLVVGAGVGAYFYFRKK